MRWVIGLIFLQLGLAGLLIGGRTHGAFAASDFSVLALGSRLSIGDTFPSLVLYDRDGRRVNFSPPKDPATLIVASCECESEIVANWSKTATNRGDRVFLIVTNTPPDQLSTWHSHFPGSMQIYAYRGQRLYSQMNLMPGSYPVQVRLIHDGLVSSFSR